jgi:hypothetical protein
MRCCRPARAPRPAPRSGCACSLLLPLEVAERAIAERTEPGELAGREPVLFGESGEAGDGLVIGVQDHGEGTLRSSLISLPFILPLPGARG